MGLHKAKKLPYCKENNKVKRQPTERKQIFTNYTTSREQISRIYKQLPKQNNPVKKWAEDNWI